MGVKTRKAFAFFGDPQGRARKMLLELFAEFGVETLAALKNVPSIPRDTLDKATNAALILGISNPTLSTLRPLPDFEGPLILPPTPRETERSRGGMADGRDYATAIDGRHSKTWARQTLLLVYRDFKVASMQELLGRRSLPLAVRKVALEAVDILGDENTTGKSLRLALRGPAVVELPSGKQRPDIPTRMRD